jgi:hypothetical protein
LSAFLSVIAKPGDEIALALEEGATGPPQDGSNRMFLLVAAAFSEEMNISSASPDSVRPFHAMKAYLYDAPEHHPGAPEYQRYWTNYNTRVVVRSVPSLDSLESP